MHVHICMPVFIHTDTLKQRNTHMHIDIDSAYFVAITCMYCMHPFYDCVHVCMHNLNRHQKLNRFA